MCKVRRNVLTPLTRLMVILSLVIGVQALASPASAATTEARVAVPMYVTGFDADVAKAHGYSTARPMNVVAGDCGSSLLTLQARPRGLHIITGFAVIHGVVAYQWAVDVHGPSGFRKTWGGSNGLDATWQGTADQGNLNPGTYSGIVTSPAYAVLEDGSICTAGPATDTKPVF